MDATPLPYTARAPRYLKAFMLGGTILVVIALWLADDITFFQFWQESPWLFRAAMIIAAVIFSVGTTGILFEKTVFTEKEIKHM
jgi:hypothetical protein